MTTQIFDVNLLAKLGKADVLRIHQWIAGWNYIPLLACDNAPAVKEIALTEAAVGANTR